MAGIHHITVDQGETFEERWTYKISGVAVDLAGYTARMKVRSKSKNLLLSLTSTNGGITLNASTGTIDLFINDTTTANFPVGKHFYDFELVQPDGKVRKLLKGNFTVYAEVTY